MAIILNEDAAKKMACPFVGGPCAGMACMGWQSKGAGRGTCLRLLSIIMEFKGQRKPKAGD